MSQRFFLLVLIGLATCGFAKGNPVPLVNQPLIPTVAAPGGAAFSLSVNGTGFVSGAVVNWNGSPRTTTFVSQTQLQATVRATDIASAGTASITVANPAPGGGVSNTVFFPVSSPVASLSMRLSSISVGVTPVAVAVGDFNGDKKMDVAVLDSKCTQQNGCASSGSVFILLGHSNGTFSPPVEFPAGYFPTALALGDFNGDGKLDLAVAHHVCPSSCSGDAAVLLGNGNGTFQPLLDYPVDNDPRSIVVADFNGDGRLDIATSDFFSAIAVLRGNGNGTFRKRLLSRSKTYATTMAVGDFNGDGRLDLALNDFCSLRACTPNAITVMLGKGTGGFQAPMHSHVPDTPDTLTAADLNGDGILDLAVSGCPNGNCGPGSLTILAGAGTGLFQQGNYYAAPEYFTGIAFGDFNSEGHLDLALLAQSSLSVLLGDGSGGFQLTGSFGAGSDPRNVASGDFNGDGRLDFVTNAAGGISVLIQN